MDEENMMQELKKQTELLEKILYALALDICDRDRRADLDLYCERWVYGHDHNYKMLQQEIERKHKWDND